MDPPRGLGQLDYETTTLPNPALPVAIGVEIGIRESGCDGRTLRSYGKWQEAAPDLVRVKLSGVAARFRSVTSGNNGDTALPLGCTDVEAPSCQRISLESVTVSRRRVGNLSKYYF